MDGWVDENGEFIEANIRSTFRIEFEPHHPTVVVQDDESFLRAHKVHYHVAGLKNARRAVGPLQCIFTYN